MPERPSLDADLSADVCVIGGGFTGVNTAIELAQRGLSVILLEARRIGWGASGRNGGQLIRGIGHDVSGFARHVGQDGVRYLEQAGIDSVALVGQRIASMASTATCAGASANWPTPRRSSRPSRTNRSAWPGLPP
jgi:2-polyprenyl-6-methoxyphenol hydroxylase-like FAD-dependent oxidoreductase